MAHHPEVQHHVADMRMAYDAAEALLERTTAELGERRRARRLARAPRRHPPDGHQQRLRHRRHGAGPQRAARASFKRNRLEQLFRDVRMGRFHPGNTMLAHELIGKLCLGLDPDDGLRWG